MADKLYSEKTHTSAFSAIEEAMKKSFWMFTKEQIYRNLNQKNRDPRDDSLKEVVKKGTRGECCYGSINVIYNLFLNSKELFKNMILISTESIKDESWLKTDVNQFFHTYFLIQDKDNIWYAGSPANHGVNSDPKYSTTVLTSGDISEVLKEMSFRDKATFPSEKFIFKTINNTSGTMPKLYGGDLSVLEIRQNSIKPEIINHNYTI